MVSTRGVRYKFSEGERVLCYEPDPTKAKVLYDSKVLEVIESKDKRGRRTIEYLIHFQGWNSSWDRCVSEDFVLKDTEENRQLQRDLAEKSQLQLGAYLYRRERKKGSSSSTTGGGPAKRARHGFSDDGSSSSTTQPDEPDAVDSDSSSGEGSDSQEHSPPPSQCGRAHIPLPQNLRDRLTFDYHLVVKRGKLLRLPATPCAAKILESFVKWFARAGAWNPQKGRHDPPAKPDITDVSCRLNLIREVADGLRVYFDFILRGHLLYKQEQPQYYDMVGRFQNNHNAQGNGRAIEDGGSDKKVTKLALPTDVFEFDAETDGKIPAEMLSPSFPEYAHLPPFPKDPDEKEKQAKNDMLFNSLFEPPRAECSEKPTTVVSGQCRPECEDPQIAAISAALREIRSTPAPRVGNVARRLRSHKSIVSQSEDEPAPSTSAGEPRTFETLSSSVGSSGSSLSECFIRPPASSTAAASTAVASTTVASTKTPLTLLLEKVASWEIIAGNKPGHLPCLVYGATHLARMFVKLPEFLNASSMSDFKLKLVLKHIDLFVQYFSRFLEDHHEWFGETYYSPEFVSTRSH